MSKRKLSNPHLSGRLAKDCFRLVYLLKILRWWLIWSYILGRTPQSIQFLKEIGTTKMTKKKDDEEDEEEINGMKPIAHFLYLINHIQVLI